MLHLLILDDDPNVCETIQEALLSSENGFSIETATQGDEAINLAQLADRDGNPFDVFLIDMKLGPGPDGIEMMQLLTRISPQADTIIFTGWENTQDGLEAFRAGAYRYMPKPVQIEELLLTLEALIDWRITRRERKWLSYSTEIAESVLNAKEFQEAADLITQGVKKLGFEDVYLYTTNGIDQDKILSRSHSGSSDTEYSKETIYFLHERPLWKEAVQKRQVQIIQSDELIVKRNNFPEIQPTEIKRKICSVLMPLWVGNDLLGLLILDDFTGGPIIRQDEENQLNLISRLIAGNLSRTNLLDKEREDAKRLELLQRASVVLLSIANADEEKFWLTLLTLITADYGLSFNRAWLFILEAGGQRLRGKAGIGHIDSELARQDWETDIASGMNFERFLKKLHKDSIKITPLHELTKKISINLLPGEDVFSKVIESSERILIQGKETSLIPTEFSDNFDMDCFAVLPLRSGQTPMGLVIVDNYHDKQPLFDVNLDRLETILNIAGLVWQSVLQRRLRQAVQEATYLIMGKVSQQPLKNTLDRICEAARTLTGAEWVVIYPLLKGREPFQYDTENIGSSGSFKINRLPNQPHPHGVSSHILRSGMLIIEDVNHDDRLIGRTRLSDHQFIQKHNIQALIGVPIYGMAGNELLGLLYIDYSNSQKFSPEDSLQANSIANLASVAIQNFRITEQVGKSLDKAEQKGLASQRELEFLQRFLELSLAGSSGKEVLKGLLINLNQAINQVGVNTTVFLNKWEINPIDGEPHEKPVGYKLNPSGSLVETPIEAFEGAFVSTILASREIAMRNYGRKIYQPVVSQSERIIGVISGEVNRSISGGDYVPILQRFATAAALALDHVRYQEYLECILQAASAGSTQAGLKGFFQSVEQAVRRITPDLSAFALWYQDPDSGKIVWGYESGVWDKTNLMLENPEPGSVIWEVMRAKQPILEENVNRNPLLARRFARSEKIVSCLAMPLIVDQEEIGVMFINYRRTHRFSRQEDAVFHLLSDVVAARIRESVHLSAISKQHKRLEAARDTAESIGSSLELDLVLEKVINILSKAFPDTYTLILFHNKEDQTLEFFTKALRHYPIENKEFSGLREFHIEDRSIASRVARQTIEMGEIIVEYVPDISLDEDYLPVRLSTRSELCASLVIEGNLLGVLVLERPKLDGFEQEDVELIRSIARQVSLAIDRVERNAQLNFKMAVSTRLAWAAEIAHDLQNAVGNIRNYAYLIQANPNNLQKVVDFSQAIQQSAEGLATMLPWYTNPQALNLDQNIRRWVTELMDARQEKINVNFELTCPNLEVHCVPTALRIILRHLVRNAAEAMAEAAHRVLVVRTAQSESNSVEIYFSDTGPGVNGELRQQLFVQKVSTKSQKGGLGLLLTRQLIEDMGGSIRLLPSPPGSGATFMMKIPIIYKNDVESDLP